jgi:hypothetical protein
MACEIARRKSGNGTSDNGTAVEVSFAGKRDPRTQKSPPPYGCLNSRQEHKRRRVISTEPLRTNEDRLVDAHA